MIELGLARISQLVKYTPLKWKAIHIAGTNGKGSVAAYLAALLSEGGLRTGRFTSPHLIDIWDCIAINDKPVYKDVFHDVEAAIKARNNDLKIGASEFELLTATAFEIFNCKHVDIGVIEVGLGGRLDATNVLPPSRVILSVITKIGLDHQALLGNTLTEIATEKGGIIKPGVPCLVDGTNDPEVLAALEACVTKARSEWLKNEVWVTPRELTLKERQALDMVERKLDLEPHQKANLRLAVDTLSYVCKLYPLDKPLSSLIESVPNIRWPGRLQMINLKPLVGRAEDVLLDGAHNLQSAEALGKYVQRKVRQPGQSITWVLAMSKGKSIEDMLRCLIQPGDVLIATQFGPVDGMPWVESARAEEILGGAQRLTKEISDGGSGTVKTVQEALIHATKIAKGGHLIIAGSLYLVSDVLRLLRDATRLEAGSEATQSRPESLDDKIP